MKFFLPLLAALALATPAVAACPNLGLKTKPAVFHTATGKHRYTLEVAASGEEQACGLMFRAEMPRDRGMIFPFTPPRDASFWMENTVLPLDLIFVGPNNRVLNVAANAVPYSRAFLRSKGPTAAVIELNAGEAARIGLKPGDRVKR